MNSPSPLEPAPRAPAAVTHLHAVGGPGAQRAAQADRLAAWVRAVAEQRDRQAFAQLFCHYAPRIKSYLVRCGCDPCQAEELAQESLLVLWRKACQFDRSRASVGTWLFTIARNLRVDCLRSAGARCLPCDDMDLQAIADEAPAPDERLQQEQTHERMAAALQGMPAEQARVLRMCYFEGQPHTRIASALQLPLGTVKSRMRAALAYLRRAMQNDSPAP